MLTPSPKPRNNLFYGAILQKDPSYVRSIIPILITATIFYIIFYLITKYRHKLKNRFLIAVVIVMALFTTIYLHFGPVKRISDYDRSNYCEFETTQYDSCDGCIY
jgi:predicted membrane chloride channel (bestrophin family)